MKRLARKIGTNSLYVLMCHTAVNQSPRVAAIVVKELHPTTATHRGRD